MKASVFAFLAGSARATHREQSQWLVEANSNAVPGCSIDCSKEIPHMKCLGSLTSAEECQASCETAPDGHCHIWTWSESTKNCWHRLDSSWEPEAWPNVTSGCLQVGKDCVPGCGACAFDTNVTVLLGAVAGVAVSPHSPAVTLDWWTHDDPRYGLQWGNASMLTLDLGNPILVALAKGLAPAVLRMGGSPLDSIEYDFDGTCQRGSGTPGGTASFTCSQTGVAAYGCLTPQRWKEFLAFGRETGLKLIFGLNACNGRPSIDDPMDFTNIQQFLNFTASLSSEDLSSLHGFEFGNEVLNTGVTGTRWAKDANVLAMMIDSTFRLAGKPAPPLFGPDHYSMDGYADVLSNLKQGTLAGITYHDYPQCLPDQAHGMVLPPRCLAALDSSAEAFSRAVASAGLPPETQVWDGEGAAHTASGGDFGHSFLPTFQSSMYYAWVQGALPINGVSLTARQCFIGGNYGLLNHSTFLPNPDYYIAWAFRQLFEQTLQGQAIGIQVNSSAPLSSGLRTFAFTGVYRRSSHVALLINLSTQQTWNVVLQNALSGSHRVAGGNATRREWHFLGSPNENATSITINGHPMQYSPGSSLPDIFSLSANLPATHPIQVKPASIIFVAF